jgi:O-acetyl-ADP-ribose deacetylase (regulator of RNase III)
MDIRSATVPQPAFSATRAYFASAPRGENRRAEPHRAVEVVRGDLTRETTDAIVNPAGAGLVDLAVRRAAGPELVEAFHQSTLALPEQRLSPGRAVVTPGFGLAAAHVIHCGPPVYADDPALAREQLAACHVEALRLARAKGLRTISIPAVGTGVYRFPIAEAAELALRTVVSELRAHPTSPRVRFVLFNEPSFKHYAEAALFRLDGPETQADRGIVFSAAGR